MPAPTPPFDALRSRLARRRFGSVDRRLRVELAGLGLLLGAFAFWQLRVRLAGVAFDHGVRAAVLVHVATLAGLAVTGGLGTAWRLRERMMRRPAGPTWLALPVAPRDLLRHQAWEAEAPLRACWIGIGAEVAAAFHIVPFGPWLASVLLVPLAWIPCVRSGARLAVSTSVPRGARIDATLAERWSRASRGAPRVPSHPPPFRPSGPVRALFRKDLWLARKAGVTRTALAMALGLGVLSIAAWFAPGAIAGARVYAFAIALMAAAAFGEWLVRLGGLDPFPVLRGQPIAVRHLWASRMLWALLITVVLVGAHTLAARGPSPARHVSLFWLALSTLSILTLAIQLQLTLFPRADHALRLFGLGLGLALVCSLMIPLFGWAVLFASVLHTARRLPRWFRLEERA